MGSSKDILEAKKLSARFRQRSKKFFDDFYAKEAKAGRYPWPHEAIAALGQILTRATEAEEGWPPQPPDRPGVSTEVLDLVTPRFFQQAYHEAVDARLRHTRGLEIKKGKPGRKREIELAERIWKLKAEGKTVPEMQAIFKAEGQHFSQEKIASYLKTRRKKLPRQ
jgi:hypothetical protein